MVAAEESEERGEHREEEEPIWEHVYELIIRLRKALLAVVAAAVILSAIPIETHSWAPFIIVFPRLIIKYVVPRQVSIFGATYNVTIMPETPFESFEVILYSAILLGVIGASPVIAYEIWEYIKPALYPHEEKMIKKYVGLSVLLFLMGVALAVGFLAPVTYRITLSLYPLLAPAGYPVIVRVSVKDVVTFTVLLALASGLVFEIPLIIYLLLANGVIDPDFFKPETMRLALLAIAIVAALLSPDPSGMGMLMLTVSLYLPFYIAVKLGKKAYYERQKKLEEEGGGGGGVREAEQRAGLPA